MGVCACGYPEWSLRKVKHQLKSRKTTKNNRKKHQEGSSKWPVIVIPYTEKVSETTARIMKKYNVPVAVKPQRMLKGVLVHPEDKQKKEDISECVYRVPCGNCDKTSYIGETGRKLGIRLQEYRMEEDYKTKRAFTRSQRTASLHNITSLFSPITQRKKTVRRQQ